MSASDERLGELQGHQVMIGVLGPLLVVRADGGVVGVPSVLRRLLLTLLVAHVGRTVTADELADWLWADRLPDDPRAALHSHVSRLRRRLGRAGIAAAARDPAAGRLAWGVLGDVETFLGTSTRRSARSSGSPPRGRRCARWSSCSRASDVTPRRPSSTGR